MEDPRNSCISVRILLGINFQWSSIIFNFMRSSSILIYLSHPVFVFLNKTFWGMRLGVELFVVTVIESLLFSMIILYLSKKYKILRILY